MSDIYFQLVRNKGVVCPLHWVIMFLHFLLRSWCKIDTCEKEVLIEMNRKTHNFQTCGVCQELVSNKAHKTSHVKQHHETIFTTSYTQIIYIEEMFTLFFLGLDSRRSLYVLDV